MYFAFLIYFVKKKYIYFFFKNDFFQINICLMAACMVAAICSECRDVLNLRLVRVRSDSDVLPKSSLFAPSLFFHAHFTMLEDKVRISIARARQACRRVGRKGGRKEDGPFSKAEFSCHMESNQLQQLAIFPA